MGKSPTCRNAPRLRLPIAPDEMARIAKVAYTNGIRQFQVKLGADSDWLTDAERLITRLGIR